jgi:DNA-binding MarR family transcriptional regulator
VTATYDEALVPSGVNTAQFSLLRKIVAAKAMTITELGRQSELDRSTTGRNVRVLERMGLVATRRGVDRREAAVSVTEQGIRALEQSTPLWNAAQSRMEAALGASAAGELRTTLNTL